MECRHGLCQRECVRGAMLNALGVLVLVVSAASAAPRMAPALFIFGDSLADPGNNNFIQTLQSRLAPNGIDFPGRRATGRYCNGRTTADVIGETLGIPDFIPAYMAPETKGAALLNGVNYASAAAGILDSSLGRILLAQQLRDFANTTAQLVQLLGEQAADDLVSKALFFSNLGANDLWGNYFVPGSPFSRNMTVTLYADMVVARYKDHLTTLYNMGARKIAVASLIPTGCCPFRLTLALTRTGQCDDEANNHVLYINKGILRIVYELNGDRPGADFTYIVVYRALGEIIAQPKAYGFTVKDKACCGLGGHHKGLVGCLPNMTICTNRLQYVFWDPYHPTEKTNVTLSARFFGDGYAYPKNLKQLLS